MNINTNINSALANTLKNSLVIEQASKSESSTNDIGLGKAEKLQADTLVLSEESKMKSAKATKQDGEKPLEIKNTDEKVLSESEKADKANKEQEQSLEDEIRQLSMEILEISIKLEQLKAKGDEKSLKESQSLEVELAIKKGVLDAKLTQQLDLAKVS